MDTEEYARKIDKLNVYRFTDIVIHLHEAGDKGVTCFELGEYAKCSHYTAQRMMRLLRKRNVVRIVRWAPDALGRNCTPAYAWGEGEDAPRTPMSRKEIHRRYKAKRDAGKPPTKKQKNAAMRYLFS